MEGLHRKYLCGIILRALLYGFIIYAVCKSIDVLEMIAFDILAVDSWVVGGFVIAMDRAFNVSIAILVLFLLGRYIRVIRGRVIPPYTQMPPLRVAASEYSLMKKKRLIISSAIVSVVLSLFSTTLSEYFINNHNDLFQSFVKIVYSDDPNPLLEFITPDVITSMNLAPEEVLPVFDWVVFSVWLPAIPLYIFITNLMSYMYEVTRPCLYYYLLKKDWQGVR